MGNALNVGPKSSIRTDVATVPNADGLHVKIKMKANKK